MQLKRLVDRSIWPVIAAVFLIAVLTAAHIRVSLQAGSYTGPLQVIDHAFSVVTVLVLLALCVAVGHSILNALKALPESPIDSLVFAAALGLGSIATLLLVVGLVGGLQRTTIAVLLVALGGLSWKNLIRVPAWVRTAIASIRPGVDGKSLAWFGIAVWIGAVAAMLLFAVAPPVDWDALMYHLQIPSQYLELGRIHLPDDNLHESHIGLIHMLYIPLLAIGSDAGPAILNVALAGFLSLASYSFCAQYLSVRTGHLVLGLFWGTTTVLLVAISPRVDLSVTLFVFLASFVLLSDLLDETADNHRYFLSAAFLGMAIGTKLSAIPYALALGPLAVWAAYKKSGTVSATARLSIGFGVCFAAVTAPWLLKNWILLGAPIYPFFAESLVPGWLTSLFGVASWPASVDPRIMEFIWELRAPFNLPDAFFAPGRLSIEVEGAHYYLNPFFLALPLWLFFIRNRVINWLLFPAIAYLVIVLAILPSPNLRYLLPAVPALTIVVAYIAVALSEKYLSPSVGRALLISFTLLALIPSGTAVQYRLSRSQALQHFVGLSSADDYMASRIGPAYVDMVNLTKQEVGSDGRILMLWDARGYYFEPRVIQDNLSVNWPLLSAILPEGGCLGTPEITHVLLGIGSFRYYVVAGGLDPERLGWSEFQRFAADCLELVRDDRALVLFRVKPPE